MAWLSRDAMDDFLGEVDKHLEKRLELEKQQLGSWDLITRAELMEKLDISATTLSLWMSKGLRAYHPPFENSKKVYFSKNEILRFLTVE